MSDSARGYLTSDDLVATVQREAMMPTNNAALSSDDLLDMADQEIRVGMLPTIMQFHQEYLVRTDVPIPIVANQSVYPIPYRAVGGKVRDVFYVDQSNNLCKLTRIDPSQQPYFQQSAVQNNYFTYFVEGDAIVLMPQVNSTPTGSLVFSYYMRPNELVLISDERVATIQSIVNTSGQGTITGISIANPTSVTSANHGLSSGNIINITNSNSSPSINGFYTITVTGVNTFTIPVNVTVAGTTGSWTYTNTIYTVDQIPQNVTPFLQNGQTVTGFTTNTLVDVCQRKPGHKTIAYDINPLAVNTVNNTLTFYTPAITTYSIIPQIIPSPVPGDYISFAGEAIIPQIPSDLHDILSQRIVCRVLQAIGDAQGYQIAASKLVEMEKLMGNLIDNRTEGNIQKVNNLSGTLRAAKAWNRIRFY